MLVVNCDFRRPLIQRYLLHNEDRNTVGADGDAMNAVVLDTELERVRLVAGIGEHDPEANPLEVVASLVPRRWSAAAGPLAYAAMAALGWITEHLLFGPPDLVDVSFTLAGARAGIGLRLRRGRR